MKVSHALTVGSLTLSVAALLAGPAAAEGTAAPAGTGTAPAAAPGAAAGKKSAAKPAVPAAAPDAAAMAAMAKYSEPNENHKKLLPLVGKWEVTSKMWMAPGQPPMESKGTSDKKLVLGGRFVEETYKSSFAGKPFAGQGMTGYDNVKGKFFNTWFDSMSTQVMVSEGQMDPSGKDLVLTGSGFDPAIQKNRTFRMVTHFESDKRQVFDWYEVGEGGKETKTMELVYTKK